LLIYSSCSRKTGNYDLFGDSEKSKPLERVTLTLFLPANGTEENEEVLEVFKVIEKQTKDSLNIHFEFAFRDYRQYFQSVEKALLEGDRCDLFYMPPYSSFINSLTEKELVMDLSSLFPRYAPVYYNSVDTEALDFFTRKGKLLAVPNKPISGNRPVAILRQDLWQNYGIPPIHDLDSFKAYLDLVKKYEPDYIPLVIDENLSLMDIFASHYGYAVIDRSLHLVYRWDDPDMNIIPWEQVPEYKEIIGEVYQWIRKDYLSSEFFSADMSSVAQTPIWGAWIADQFSVQAVNYKLAQENKDFRYIEFPLFPEDRIQQRSNDFQGFSISAFSENAQRAMMFIQWIHGSQENYDLVRYGIEGEHYLLHDQKYSFPEGVDLSKAYQNWQYDGFLNFEYERLLEGSTMGDSEAIKGEYLEKLTKPPHSGFHLDTSQMDITLRERNLYQVERAIVMGNFNSNTIDNYIKDQKTWGTDIIVLQTQKQLNNWREEQNEEN